MDPFVYEGHRTKALSFPLGGIGTGCIGLAGNGRLIDWEIFNRPNKGGLNGFSHFAVKAEVDGKTVDARILNGDLLPPYTGFLEGPQFNCFGFGPARETLAGLPHFSKTRFRGEFPMAILDFRERRFPGSVRLTAFNPFIPLNDRDSSIPAAFLEFEVHNTTKLTTDYTLAGTLCNPLPGTNLNIAGKRAGVRFLSLGAKELAPDALEYGDLTVATDAETTSVLPYWYKGHWHDELEFYWRTFFSPGSLGKRTLGTDNSATGTHGTLAAHLKGISPGGKARVRFAIAWNFPNCQNYWDKQACRRTEEGGAPATWKNYYAILFSDSKTSAHYALKNWDRLYGETRRFKDALFSSSLPPAVLDAVSANLSVLKSPTCLRLEDGTFYGWEGCHPSAGCCEGSCTHVWNYAQALPFLFPALERSMRDADYRYNLSPDGGMAFRLQLPLGEMPWDFRPCADGHFGGVMKIYRDWKICGDSKWLASLWPAIKQNIEFAWSPENKDQWDPDRTGVLWGAQHHTLDMELFGPNSWLTGFYLGALKAAVEIAEHLGDWATATEYRAVFDRGRTWVEEHLFNGDYYCQHIDLDDRHVVLGFKTKSLVGKPGDNVYWDEEHGEIKYQLGEGCGVDQVLAQWHADLYDLGEIFPKSRVRKALRAIYRNNFKNSVRNHVNPCRLYCLNDEAGLVIATWPDKRRRPAFPLTYAQETMHGFEYAAASHMIRHGMVRQGMRVVRGVRDRYDGERRNPWNEFECGSNYARSMASYALLNAFSGFTFDMAKGMVGFDPVETRKKRFRCFWSLDSGWGLFEKRLKTVSLRVLYGRLTLKAFRLPSVFARGPVRVLLDGKQVKATLEGNTVHLEQGVTIHEGQTLKFSETS